MAVHWVIKNQTEYRVDSMPEVEDFHKCLQQKAIDEGYTLTNFSWAHKEKKKQGEVIDEWFVVKVTFLFNDAKEPENGFFEVNFPKKNIDIYEG